MGVTTPDVPRGGCRWLSTFEHSFQTGSERKPEAAQVSCCHCGNKIEYTESWVTVPYGVHGNLLPLPVFVHCWTCSLILDPTTAYQEAYRKDSQASAPDPLKLLRQEELDRLHAAETKPHHH
jgi:hypothetical protein